MSRPKNELESNLYKKNLFGERARWKQQEAIKVFTWNNYEKEEFT